MATQSARLARGLDPVSKSVRCANYIKSMRRDLLKVSEAIGVAHPGLITVDDIDLVDSNRSHRSLREVFGYEAGWSSLAPDLAAEINRIMAQNLPAPESAPHR